MNSTCSPMTFPATATVPTLYNLIDETFKLYEANAANADKNSYANCLITLLKKHHVWPLMKVKKFKGRSDIVLLHNSYIRNNIDNFKELYEQCRSVVLDFSLERNYNIVVTYANSIPERVNYNHYITSLYSPEDKIYEAYDGTIITVYNYKDEWHFGTSSCPDANSSKFSHPTKTHGNMFDEILYKYFKQHITEDGDAGAAEGGEVRETVSQKLRSVFTQHLDPNMAYEFIIVHHENKHIIDYAGFLGENYMEMFHVNTKHRNSLVESDIMSSVIPSLMEVGVKYPMPFNTIQEAYAHINTNPYSYGLIVKKNIADKVNVKIYKISTDAINYREETDPCHPNAWMNILSVYMKNKTEYTIKDYLANYNPYLNLPLDNNGQKIDPTYLVHTIISTIKDSLYAYYKATTTYYPNYNRYKMNKEMDKQFPPIIQYHLAQLRNLQINTYKSKMITLPNVYHYICQCNDINNIKTLIQFFASNPINEMPPRTSMCFAIMTSLIS